MSGSSTRTGLLAALALLLSLVPTVAAAEDEARQPLIFSGGDADNPGFVAYLETEDAGGDVYSCTGSLVTPGWVLTAAHCLEDMVSVVVSVGTDDWRDGQVRSGVDWKLHPTYAPTAPLGSASSIDLGLVRLDAPVNGISPIRPNLRPELPEYLQLLVVAGWGRVDAFGPVPFVLQAGVTEATSGPDGTFDPFSCQRPSSPEAYFCFGGLTAVTACPGDSGGPLFSRHDPDASTGDLDTLYGVVSYGDVNACLPSSLDSGAVNVAPVVPWISSVTGGFFGFADVPDSSTFKADIDWLARKGITRGCNPPANTKFCPKDPITREQFAAFWTRALDLTANDGMDFEDVSGDNIFRTDIQRLATAEITKGCNPPTNTKFCPKGLVTREQFAAFAVRGLELTENDFPTFDDVPSTSIFHGDIQRLATADITKGCNPPANTKFCPKDPMTREQFAAFARRALEPVLGP